MKVPTVGEAICLPFPAVGICAGGRLIRNLNDCHRQSLRFKIRRALQHAPTWGENSSCFLSLRLRLVANPPPSQREACIAANPVGEPWLGRGGAGIVQFLRVSVGTPLLRCPQKFTHADGHPGTGVSTDSDGHCGFPLRTIEDNKTLQGPVDETAYKKAPGSKARSGSG